MISIIIPVYNSSKYISKCLDSVINQTMNDLQIIIINDGSTDNSDEIINEYVKKDKRIDYYKIKNHGVSYARNYGLSKVKGKYVMFVDSDDIICNLMCEQLLKNMENYNADLSICNYEIISEQTIQNKIHNLQVTTISDKKYSYLFNLYKGYLCNKMYKIDVIIQHKLKLNENIYMCEDLLFNFEYMKHISKVVYTENKLYGYFINDSNCSKKLSTKWFSILTAYKIILNDISRYDIETKSNILLNLFYVLFESKVRCEMMNLSFEDICLEHEIDYKNFKKKYLNKTICNHKLKLKKRLKLFLFYKIYFISKKYKMKKISGKKV